MSTESICVVSLSWVCFAGIVTETFSGVSMALPGLHPILHPGPHDSFSKGLNCEDLPEPCDLCQRYAKDILSHRYPKNLPIFFIGVTAAPRQKPLSLARKQCTPELLKGTSGLVWTYSFCPSSRSVL